MKNSKLQVGRGKRMPMDRTPSRKARKAHDARLRRRENWMPGFAVYAANRFTAQF